METLTPEKISDLDLALKLRQIAVKEGTAARFGVLLAEMARRELYVDLGFVSLADYCASLAGKL
ncbi:MAG: hypothetical protein WC881_07830 [Elusimicrobiota bacterium]